MKRKKEREDTEEGKCKERGQKPCCHLQRQLLLAGSNLIFIVDFFSFRLL